MWHSLDESGYIAVYDVEWADGSVETDIPASLLEGESDINELHEKHGSEGHKKDSEISERKYKKKDKKKKAEKSKRNKNKIYPYFYGINDREPDNYYEPSLEGGFVGGFESGGD